MFLSLRRQLAKRLSAAFVMPLAFLPSSATCNLFESIIAAPSLRSPIVFASGFFQAFPSALTASCEWAARSLRRTRMLLVQLFRYASLSRPRDDSRKFTHLTSGVLYLRIRRRRYRIRFTCDNCYTRHRTRYTFSLFYRSQTRSCNAVPMFLARLSN